MNEIVRGNHFDDNFQRITRQPRESFSPKSPIAHQKAKDALSKRSRKQVMRFAIPIGAK
jgi:hypothetical protein